MNAESQEECCPKFDPKPWDGKTFEWNNKKFIKEKVRTFFYMPLNFGSVMRKLDKKARQAGATIQDGMGLSDHTSKWKMDIYVAVDKEVPGAENTTLSGKFLSKVYEGEFKETGDWCKDFESYAKGKNMEVKKWYMWYTTCPNAPRNMGRITWRSLAA